MNKNELCKKIVVELSENMELAIDLMIANAESLKLDFELITSISQQYDLCFYHGKDYFRELAKNLETIEYILTKNLEINHVVIRDYSDYDPNKCNNGGKYLYTTTVGRLAKNVYKLEEHTSCDFLENPVFEKIISLNHLNDMIEKYKKDENVTIEVEYKS